MNFNVGDVIISRTKVCQITKVNKDTYEYMLLNLLIKRMFPDKIGKLYLSSKSFVEHRYKLIKNRNYITTNPKNKLVKRSRA